MERVLFVRFNAGMSPIVLIVALVFGLVAAAYYARALQQIQPRLVSPLRDEVAARHALDVIARWKLIPAQARRDYVLSLAYSCVFIVCVGILAYREGSRVVAVIFAGIALLGAATTFARWLRTHR